MSKEKYPIPEGFRKVASNEPMQSGDKHWVDGKWIEIYMDRTLRDVVCPIREIQIYVPNTTFPTTCCNVKGSHAKWCRIGNTQLNTFDEVRLTNRARCKERHGPASEPWTGADWGNALAGEVGDLCYLIKKIRRIETGVEGSQDPDIDTLKKQVADEIADIFLYLDCTADHFRINLWDSIKRRFNAVSEKEGFPHKL